VVTALVRLSVLSAAAALAADPAFESAQKKLDSLKQGRVKAGATLVFTPAEVNSWAREKLPVLAPAGIRNLYIDLGTDVVTASALVDLLKVSAAAGNEPGWVASRLFEGERPVRVTARIVSGNGRATVYLSRVEVSGAAVTGAALDFLIQNVARSVYPEIKVNEPVELDYDIDRVEIRPSGVRVTIPANRVQ
jgi:hypothetical protein